jgi:hypothetical protein
MSSRHWAGSHMGARANTMNGASRWPSTSGAVSSTVGCSCGPDPRHPGDLGRYRAQRVADAELGSRSSSTKLHRCLLAGRRPHGNPDHAFAGPDQLIDQRGVDRVGSQSPIRHHLERVIASGATPGEPTRSVLDQSGGFLASPCRSSQVNATTDPQARTIGRRHRRLCQI